MSLIITDAGKVLSSSYVVGKNISPQPLTLRLYSMTILQMWMTLLLIILKLVRPMDTVHDYYLVLLGLFLLLDWQVIQNNVGISRDL